MNKNKYFILIKLKNYQIVALDIELPMAAWKSIRCKDRKKHARVFLKQKICKYLFK